MIIGAFLRYIKTYSGINYIPLSNGESFCGLVGINGIGKSSVLEALDSHFNNKDWNFNIATKRSGFSTTTPYIVPIYLIEKTALPTELHELCQAISDTISSAIPEEILPKNRSHFEILSNQLTSITAKHDFDAHFLLPLGEAHTGEPHLAIFQTKKILEKIFPDAGIDSNDIPSQKKTHLKELLTFLKGYFEYVYIPKEITPEQFTQLETKEIQSLMGESLTDVIKRSLPSNTVNNINTGLKSYLDELSQKLPGYSFRTPTDRQKNIRKNDVYALITDAFFNIRKLHKQEGETWIELSALSSGEKQKAIIDVVSNLLTNYRANADKVILAIDEPEASLHVSACFDQFNTLFKMSQPCRQLLFTTHWYGFLPTINSGYVSIITKKDNDHNIDLIDICSFRESIKQQVKSSKGKLPYDIRLKSVNDFIQSIISSVISDMPYNWLIVEGSSDQIYLQKYLEDLIDTLKLKIIPVGGASEIKKIYQHLLPSFEEFKSDIRGKIFLVTDTDSQIVSFHTKEYQNLRCKRIINHSSQRKTILAKIESTLVAPSTEIEDCLNGKLFLETLLHFKEKYPKELAFTDSLTLVSEEASYFALDLSPSQKTMLDSFFDVDDNKKHFAIKYSTICSQDDAIPAWIGEIKSYFLS